MKIGSTIKTGISNFAQKQANAGMKQAEKLANRVYDGIALEKKPLALKAIKFPVHVVNSLRTAANLLQYAVFNGVNKIIKK